jgi:hypothetical protein
MTCSRVREPCLERGYVLLLPKSEDDALARGDGILAESMLSPRLELPELTKLLAESRWNGEGDLAISRLKVDAI